MDEAAEFLCGLLLLLQERGAGEGDVAGIGEHPSHLGGKAPVVRPVAFIDHHEDVRALIPGLILVHDRRELVDDRGDDAGFALGDELGQVFPRPCPFRGLAAGLEGS